MKEPNSAPAHSGGGANAGRRLVTCVGCALLCDDLETRSGEEHPPTHLCEIGLDWWQQGLQARHAEPPRLNDQEIPWSTVWDTAADWLSAARFPIITGLSSWPRSAQHSAVQLARHLRGAIGDDSPTTSGVNAGGVDRGLLTIGRVTATFGEWTSRSDLVVWWFVSPEEIPPRIWERGRWNSPRHVWVTADPEQALPETLLRGLGTSGGAVQIWQTTLEESRQWLAAASSFENVVDRCASETADSTRGGASELEQWLAQSRIATWVVGSGFWEQPDQSGPLALSRFVRRRHPRQRVYTATLGPPDNRRGAKQVLLAETGFSDHVNFQSGLPRSHGREFSPRRLIPHDWCDVVVWGRSSSACAVAEWGCQVGKKWIVLDQDLWRAELSAEWSRAPSGTEILRIPVAYRGWESGDWCRFDEVSIPVRAPSSTDRPTVLQVLSRVRQALDAR